MSLLASDFEESFGSKQMGSVCPEAYFEWIQYVIERCPPGFYDAMSTDIIRAFFNSDPNLFAEMFGPAVAGIIYNKGHLLSLAHTACFIERKTIGFTKLRNCMESEKFKYLLHIYLGNEEIGRLQLPIDPLPNWENGVRYTINNPYYECSE